MKGVIKGFAIIGGLLLLPFGYFFYTDIISSGDISTLDSCTPYNVEWESEENEMALSWETREKCVGYVRYGTDTKSLTNIAADSSGAQSKKQHSVMLKNLSEETDYYVIFYSGDETYGQSGQPLVLRID